MKAAFQSFIEKEKLVSQTDRLVLAVSGGVDSMVMLELFRQTEYDFVVAHCNFKLRGDESDDDELFVRDYCQQHDITFYCNVFDTEEYALSEGISIEMAARDLRYQWFYQILDELSFSVVATAHHQDDVIETILINLSRGTGIRGLTGIRPVNGRVIRPMLFANRADILNYAEINNTPFRIDSTNNELIYQRNVIRNQIIPLLQDINPAFDKNMLRTAQILKETESLYIEKIAEIKRSVIVHEAGFVKFSILVLKTYQEVNTILFELLRPYGFRRSVVYSIVESFDADAGKIFFSKTHRLVKDRSELIITPIRSIDHSRFYIEVDTTSVSLPVNMSLQVIDRDGSYKISSRSDTVDLDYDTIVFPLIIKKWEQGEYFQPLGMKGLKKVSDFFVDEKLSIPQKENQWILYSGNEVVWIIGLRIDDRYKITPESKNILRINILK